MAHMHRCLDVPELVQHIVDSLLPAEGEQGKGAALLNDQPAMSALARLARTSKIFHSPAIGRLWGTQFGIHNLILCMPVDLFFKLDTLVSVSRMLVPLKYINFRRALQPSDWERFDYYAAHIRELVFPGHEPVLVQVSEAVYTALARYNDHPRPYLTRLRSLAFTSRTEPPALSDMCMALLGPSVEELTVMPGPNDSASAVVALAHASYLSASLARLDIDFRSSPDPSRLLAGALRNLRELRRLSIMMPTGPSEVVWEIIAGLPLLAVLNVGRHMDESECTGSLLAPAKEPDRRRRLELSQVSHLGLVNFRMPDCADLLNRFDLPRLAALSVSYPPGDSYTGGEQLLEAVVDRCPPALSELRIEPSDRLSAVLGISTRSLRPLHIFHDLQRLHVSHVRDLNDGILFEGAAAWPALEELVLTTHPGSGATLLGLTYVAETCQHLRALAFDVDVSPEAMKESRWPLDAPQRGARPNTRVTALDVRAAPLYEEEVAAVAEALVGSFTGLVTILQMGKASTGVWRMVQDVLPTLYAERKA